MRAVAGNTWGTNKKVLLTIYRSLIRSVLDYGAIAYYSASESTKSRLDVIQHKALRIACGAFCSTSVSALEVETGEMPLALRSSQLKIKYAVKVKATKSHPAKSVREFHWTTLRKKFKPNNLPIYSKTQEYFSGSPAESVQAPVLPEEAPWLQKACSVDSSLINVRGFLCQLSFNKTVHPHTEHETLFSFFNVMLQNSSHQICGHPTAQI